MAIKLPAQMHSECPSGLGTPCQHYFFPSGFLIETGGLLSRDIWVHSRVSFNEPNQPSRRKSGFEIDRYYRDILLFFQVLSLFLQVSKCGALKRLR